MTAAIGVVGGWLVARQGRKVRVKIGDTEVEARTVTELEAILELAQKHIAATGPEDGSDSL